MFKFWGQPSTGPRTVFAQEILLIRDPNSPPPLNSALGEKGSITLLRDEVETVWPAGVLESTHISQGGSISHSKAARLTISFDGDSRFRAGPAQLNSDNRHTEG